jgi:hypothetical protein
MCRPRSTVSVWKSVIKSPGQGQAQVLYTGGHTVTAHSHMNPGLGEPWSAAHAGRRLCGSTLDHTIDGEKTLLVVWKNHGTYDADTVT